MKGIWQHRSQIRLDETTSEEICNKYDGMVNECFEFCFVLVAEGVTLSYALTIEE